MSSSLYHHGIKGMKWGVRRYQNKDGTLTDAGKKRYRDNVGSMSDEELSAKVKRMNLEKAYNNMNSQRSKASGLEKSKKVLDSASNLVNQAKKMNSDSISRNKTREKLDLSNMTDKELRDRINRTNLERQYNDLFAKETVSISNGRRFATDVLEVAGSALAIGSSALGIALAIKELRS